MTAHLAYTTLTNIRYILPLRIGWYFLSYSKQSCFKMGKFMNKSTAQCNQLPQLRRDNYTRSLWVHNTVPVFPYTVDRVWQRDNASIRTVILYIWAHWVAVMNWREPHHGWTDLLMLAHLMEVMNWCVWAHLVEVIYWCEPTWLNWWIDLSSPGWIDELILEHLV